MMSLLMAEWFINFRLAGTVSMDLIDLVADATDLGDADA